MIAKVTTHIILSRTNKAGESVIFLPSTPPPILRMGGGCWRNVKRKRSIQKKNSSTHPRPFVSVVTLNTQEEAIVKEDVLVLNFCRSAEKTATERAVVLFPVLVPGSSLQPLLQIPRSKWAHKNISYFLIGFRSTKEEGVPNFTTLVDAAE